MENAQIYKSNPMVIGINFVTRTFLQLRLLDLITGKLAAAMD